MVATGFEIISTLDEMKPSRTRKLMNFETLKEDV